MNPQKLKHKCLCVWVFLFSFFSIIPLWFFLLSKSKKRHNYIAHRVDLGNWYWWRQTIDCQMSKQLPPLIIPLIKKSILRFSLFRVLKGRCWGSSSFVISFTKRFFCCFHKTKSSTYNLINFVFSVWLASINRCNQLLCC